MRASTAVSLGSVVTSRSSVRREASLPNVAEVAPGTYHMCAKQQSGRVWCWGQGSKGQLGNGDTSEKLTPVEVVW